MTDLDTLRGASGSLWETTARWYLQENFLRTLRILIADDHGLVRRGVRSILQANRGWKIIGETSNGRETLERS